ncbi:MAG: aldo/keto reductase [Chloroflexota bacterium]
MQYRVHEGFNLSEIGIGCYALGGSYGEKDVGAFRRMLGRAVELGVNYFDAADSYGDAERVLGEELGPYREQVYIATKVGVAEGVRADLSSAYVKFACERSLNRLQTEYIDLYQVHFDDPETPVGETVEVLDELVGEGKIRRFGLGHVPLEKMKNYFEYGKVFSVLTEFSAVAREARREVIPLCHRHGVGVIAFSVTGRGILTGKMEAGVRFEPGDIRHVEPLFQRERYVSALRVADRFTEVGRRYGRTPVQVAIAWVLSHPGVTCALTGPSTIPHLEENLGGSGWLLSPEDLDDLEGFFRDEEEWLRGKQLLSVKTILTTPLSSDLSQAFGDLIYAIETGLLLGLVTEGEVLPSFYELYEMKDRLRGAGSKLTSLQQQLRELIPWPPNGGPTLRNGG